MIDYLNDPFGRDEDPFKAKVKRQRPEFRKPFAPEEAASLMSSLPGRGLSGLSYIASALDKPGRAVRGLLGGKPHELLAALPLSDSFGITNPDDAVSGRDITNNIGLTKRGDKGWGSFGAGIAAEMLTDPLTYLSFGAKTALTPAGIAASKAGSLRGLSRAETIDKGFGGLMGVGLPFANPSAVLGTGRTARAVAGGIDKAADFAEYGNPIGRQLGAWFDSAKQGPNGVSAIDEVSQRAMKKHGTPAYEAKKRAEGSFLYDTISAMNKMKGVAPDADIVHAVKLAREGQPLLGVAPALQGDAYSQGAKSISHYEKQLADEVKLGISSKNVNDPFAQYAPRVADAAVDKGGAQFKATDSLIPTKAGDSIHRKKLLRSVPGGEAMLDRWHSTLAGTAAPDASKTIMDDMVNFLLASGHAPDPINLKLLHDKSGKLGNWISKFPAPAPGQAGKPLYTPNIPFGADMKGERHAGKIRSGEAILGGLSDLAKATSKPGTKMIPMTDALKKMKLTTRMPDQVTGDPAVGAMVEILNRLGVDVAGQGLDQDFKALRSAVKGHHVPEEQVNQLARSYQKWTNPTDTAATLKGYDSLASMFKNLSYSVWIPSHVRNMMSAAHTNLMTGTSPGDMLLSKNVMRGTATAADIAARHPGLPAGLSDDAAREWLNKRAFVDAGIYKSPLSDDAVSRAANPGKLFPEVPGTGRTGPTGSLIGDILNLGKEAVVGAPANSMSGKTSPFDFFGQGGVLERKTGELRKRDTWSPLAAGRVAGTNIEDHARLANYIGYSRQGYAGPEAGRLVNKYHFDYGKSTGFEKKVMKRLVPFYTFQRSNLPLQLGTLATRPANISMQLRPLGKMQTGYTPDWLSSGVAIPQGENQDGTQRYISQLGLPIEEAFERMKFSGGLPDIKGTAMAYAAGLNPLIKGPLEQLSNTQFFSGRRLSDLRPTTAGSLGGALGDENAGLLTQMISNSPATRFATAADKLADPRKSAAVKALNLLTGVRVTDVDVEKAKAIEARKSLEELLRKAPHLSQFTNFFVKPDDVAQLTPEEVEMMKLYANSQEASKAYAKAKKQGK